jgi:hypothetical protein
MPVLPSVSHLVTCILSNNDTGHKSIVNIIYEYLMRKSKAIEALRVATDIAAIKTALKQLIAYLVAFRLRSRLCFLIRNTRYINANRLTDSLKRNS